VEVITPQVFPAVLTPSVPVAACEYARKVKTEHASTDKQPPKMEVFLYSHLENLIHKDEVEKGLEINSTAAAVLLF
jgi:hypothetical protein